MHSIILCSHCPRFSGGNHTILSADPRETSNEVYLLGTQRKTANQSDFWVEGTQNSLQRTQPEKSARWLVEELV